MSDRLERESLPVILSLRRKEVWGLCEEVRAEGLYSCPLLSVACGKRPLRLSSCNKPFRTDLCWEQKSCNLKPEKGCDKSLDWNTGAYSLILGQFECFLGFPGRSQYWTESIFLPSFSFPFSFKSLNLHLEGGSLPAWFLSVAFCRELAGTIQNTVFYAPPIFPLSTVASFWVLKIF